MGIVPSDRRRIDNRRIVQRNQFTKVRRVLHGCILEQLSARGNGLTSLRSPLVKWSFHQLGPFSLSVNLNFDKIAERESETSLDKHIATEYSQCGALCTTGHESDLPVLEKDRLLMSWHRR